MSHIEKRFQKESNPNHNSIFIIPSSVDIEQYVCEDCNVRLALYPQAILDNPHAGTTYICPKCHNVTDATLNTMQREDKIKPVEIASPSFGIVPENKSWTERLFPNYYNVNDHDPEPQEDAILKAQGAKIIESKIDAKNDL